MAKVTMHEGENDFVGAMVFQKRVKLALSDMPPDEPLIVNLSQLYIDSTAIGTLLALFMSCKRIGRPMTLENVSPETHKLLHVTGVDTLFGLPDGPSKS